MALEKRRAGEDFAPFCHFSASQQSQDTFPSPKKGCVLLITPPTAQGQQVTIQPLCCELEITLQKSEHLSPFSALVTLHWFTQLQNKTNLSTPQNP